MADRSRTTTDDTMDLIESGPKDEASLIVNDTYDSSESLNEKSSCASFLFSDFDDQVDYDDCSTYSEYEMDKTVRLLGGKERRKHLQLYYTGAPLAEGLTEAASRGDHDMVRTYTESGVCVDSVNEFENSALFLASYYGHIDIVRYLIDCSANKEICGNMSQTKQSVLHAAAMSGKSILVQFLTQNTSFVNAIDGAGETPLHLASRRGHHALVPILAESGTDVNIQNVLGQNCLYCALQGNHRDTIEAILKTDVDINASDIHGNTPLHKAKSNAVTKQLVQRGANINCRNSKGETPLYFSARLLQLDKMKTLLENNADPDIADDNSIYPLHQAALADIDMVSVLASAGGRIDPKDNAGRTPFHYAAEELNLDVLKLLWKCGADINNQDFLGYTAIYEMCWNPEIENCRLLLQELIKMGCNVNLMDCAGTTPMIIAAFVAPLEAVTVLNESGADINHCDNYGRTALMASTERPEMVRHLVAQGADVTIQDKSGFTFLHHCAAENWVESAECAVSRNRKLLELRDNYMATALHVASSEGSSEMVKYLIGCGLGVNDRDQNGCTPLHYAAYTGHQDIFVLLLNVGADTNIADNCGKTAFSCAYRRRHHNLMCYIEESYGKILQRKRLSNRFTDRMKNLPVDNGEELCLERDKMIEMLDVERGEPDGAEDISDILHVSSVGAVTFRSGESMLIRDTFCLMAKCISVLVCEKDRRFRCEVVLAGSVSEKTKVGDPDEFDFMFILKEFGHLCQPPRLEDRENTIFTPLRSSSETIDIPEDFRMFFKNGILLRSKVYNTFAYLLTAAVTSKEFQWPANVQPYLFWSKGYHDDSKQVTICHQFKWKCQQFKSLLVSVDMVPTIHMSDWPADATCSLVTDEMRLSGYHLVAKPFERTSPNIPISAQSHLVNENLWRISYAVAERIIFDNMDERLKDSYRIAKAMRHEEICPKILITHEGEKSVIKCHTVIPTYFIKVCLFNLLISGELKDTADELVTKVGVVKIFKNLELAFSSDSLPYSFVPSYNLVQDTKEVNSKEMITSFCRMLCSIAST